MNPVIYVREKLAESHDVWAMREFFPVVTNRGDVPDGSLVIPRYSLLPHPEEVHYDLEKRGCVLANTLDQHRWIANFRWYEDLQDHTPRTWDSTQMATIDHDGPFVVKGATNSLKWRWNTHMYAANKEEMIQVVLRLHEDSLIGYQPLKIREYVPLAVHEPAVVGPPFAYEFRFFFWGERLLGSGYYWSTADNPSVEVPDGALAKARECAKIAAQHARFFVLDIAKTEDGEWILIEVNDGQQSGLSEVDPRALYATLRLELQGILPDNPTMIPS